MAKFWEQWKLESGYIAERINENFVNFAFLSKGTISLKEVALMPMGQYLELLMVFNHQIKKSDAANSSKRNT